MKLVVPFKIPITDNIFVASNPLWIVEINGIPPATAASNKMAAPFHGPF